MAGARNKVKFNLKNVHIAVRTAEGYDTPFAMPGAVTMSLTAQGDIEKFYADGIVYYQSSPNNGYEGTLEMALITDEFRQKIFNETPDEKGKVMIENVDTQYNDFAMGFQVDGDQKNTLFWYFNGTATRPDQNASTNQQSKTPQTEQLKVSFTCDAKGNVRAKTTEETPDDVREAWFSKVYDGQVGA